MSKEPIRSTTETLNHLHTIFSEGAGHVTVIQAVETFLLAEMAGKSSQTAAWYRRRLVPMAEALGAGRPLIELMEADLIEWYHNLETRTRRYAGSSNRPEIEGGLSKDTLHGYVRAAKRFFSWLARKSILTADISADLKLPRLPRRGRKGLGDDQAGAILEAAQDSPRDYALIRFMESTGVRRGGVAHLLLSDLNLDSENERIRRRATVREKGDKERTVVMTASALQALEAWLAVRPQVNDDHVFLGKAPGRPWRALTEVGISEILRRYKLRLGISGKVSPHQWRHRWCRKRLQEGMGLKQVSQLAGHEDIGVTAMFYGGFSIEELQDSYDKHVKD